MKRIDWKQYKDIDGISTDALWFSSWHKNDGKFLIPKRDIFKDFNRDFHGLFIPEIPYQFILRFARKAGLIWEYVLKIYLENKVLSVKVISLKIMGRLRKWEINIICNIIEI